MRLALFALLIVYCGCTIKRPNPRMIPHSPSQGRFNVPELLERQRKNNEQEVALVSYMIYGMPQVVLFSDGRLLTKANSGNETPSNWRLANLSENEVEHLLGRLAGIGEFYDLENDYKLSEWSDQPLHRVRVQLRERPEKRVSVYGALRNQRPGDIAPPSGFREFISVLMNFQPTHSRPWDPGYVEVSFADYSWAPDPSVHWPVGWPSLGGALVSDVSEGVIKKVMIFPSECYAKLDAFLKTKNERGAVLIEGWKTSVHYRWPLPGEEYWTAWRK